MAMAATTHTDICLCAFLYIFLYASAGKMIGGIFYGTEIPSHHLNSYANNAEQQPKH